MSSEVNRIVESFHKTQNDLWNSPWHHELSMRETCIKIAGSTHEVWTFQGRTLRGVCPDAMSVLIRRNCSFCLPSGTKPHFRIKSSKDAISANFKDRNDERTFFNLFYSSALLPASFYKAEESFLAMRAEWDFRRIFRFQLPDSLKTEQNEVVESGKKAILNETLHQLQSVFVESQSPSPEKSKHEGVVYRVIYDGGY